MKKTELTYDLVKAVTQKMGYPFFTGHMNLNFIGIRTNNRNADNYDDFFCMLWQEKDSKGNVQNKIWVNDKFTTDPGLYYLQMKLLNPNGCAIMVPGHYPKLWTLGLHGRVNPYEAFVQVGAVKVYRDRNKDNVLDGDPETITESAGLGINQHHNYDTDKVGKGSAGCQVHSKRADLNYVKDTFKLSIPYFGKYISYTLLEEKDFK